MSKKITKVELNLDYKGRKLGTTITFSPSDREQQKEAFEIVNSGIGKIIESE